MRRFNFLIIILIISAASNLACVKPVKIEGSAMLPNYKNGERYLIETSIETIKRGDVITFLYPKDQTKWYIKRVIGLPNETIEIKNGKVLINGNELNEPYLDQNYNQMMPNFALVKIPADHYFAMGDNRDNSADSRIWGTVSKDLIQGKLWYKYSGTNDE